VRRANKSHSRGTVECTTSTKTLWPTTTRPETLTTATKIRAASGSDDGRRSVTLPPPLSAQPFTNDASFDPATLETGGLDTTRPKLRKVALDRSGRRLKLRFRVSERSAVTVRLVRAGKRVRTKRVSARSRGSVTLRGLRPGRYRVQLRARDLAGNASGARVAHVTVG